MMFTPRPKGLGKENFLKLNDQEEVTGMFAGEIHTFKQHWRDNKSTECIGKGCNICAVDPENFPAFRFRVNFITLRNDQWVAKIFEGGGKVYDALVNLDKKFNLTRTPVDITRRGMKQNTSYDIFPRMDIALTADEEVKIKAVALLKLSTGDSGKGEAA